MGCSGGTNIKRSELLCQNPINVHIRMCESLNIKDYNKICSFAKDTENIRSCIVDELDYISLITGNCSHKFETHNLYYCFVALISKLAVDNKAKLENAELITSEEDEFYFRYNSRFNTLETDKMIEKISNYCVKINKLKSKVKDLKVTFTNEIAKIINNLEELIKVEIDDDINNFNLNIIKNCDLISDDFMSFIVGVLEEAKEGIKLLKNKEKYSDINLIAFKNCKNQIKIPYLIVWNNLEEKDKYSDPKEGLFKINQFIVNKKKKKTEYQEEYFKFIGYQKEIKNNK